MTKQPTFLHDLLSKSVPKRTFCSNNSLQLPPYQVECWILRFQVLCAIPMEQPPYFSLFRYLYLFFPQVPQNISVWPYLVPWLWQHSWSCRKSAGPAITTERCYNYSWRFPIRYSHEDSSWLRRHRPQNQHRLVPSGLAQYGYSAWFPERPLQWFNATRLNSPWHHSPSFSGYSGLDDRLPSGFCGSKCVKMWWSLEISASFIKVVCLSLTSGQQWIALVACGCQLFCMAAYALKIVLRECPIYFLYRDSAIKGWCQNAVIWPTKDGLWFSGNTYTVVLCKHTQTSACQVSIQWANNINSLGVPPHIFALKCTSKEIKSYYRIHTTDGKVSVLVNSPQHRPFLHIPAEKGPPSLLISETPPSRL